jgi:PAT family beta-lactamase induction signal transducer AmpG
MLIMLFMSFSSGLPITLVLGTLQLWYAKVGISIVAIGALTLVGQPYAYKFIWAPLMDRYVPPFLGRRRGWILITQLCLLVSIFLMALLSPTTHPIALAIMAIVVAFFSASQDISLDAYRTDLLQPSERGVASAIWGNGYRLAMIVTSAAPLIIAYHVGWHIAYMSMSLLMLVGIITTFFSPEPDSGIQAPATLKVAIFSALGEFLKRPYATGLLLFIVVYKLGDAFALSLSSVFYLKGVGFNLEQIAWVGKTFGTIAGILGIILGGALMVRWKLYKALMAFGWLQALSILGFVAMALASKSMPLFAAVVFFEHLTGGMGTAAFLVLLMALCDKRFTATQYALFSAVMVIGRTFMGPIAGVTVEHYGWSVFFFGGFILAILGLLLLCWLQGKIDFNQEQIK